MFTFKIFKCCMRREEADPEVLPLVRIVSLNIMPMNITSHLPVTAKPIPQLEVSVSSSTAVAMFEHESTISMRSPHDSYTSNDTFEDVDLSTPTKFATPPKVRKAMSSPVDDQHEANSSLIVSGSLNKGKEVSDASTPCSMSSIARGKQPIRVASPFDDGHEVESESAIEYAPTTPASENDYTERALEYQRVSLLFGSGSPEYNNLQRDHALAVLEGTKPQSTQPLDPELMKILAAKMGHLRQY